MINAIQLRKGMVIRLNEKIYRVEEMKHITPGKGNAVVQTKIRDLGDMSIRDYRFRSVDKVERVTVETKKYLYSYQDGDHYIFMDHETYEQISLDGEFLQDILYYLKENEDYFIEFISDKPVNITPPLSMEYQVMEAEESIKGATVQSSYKPATLDNGMKIMVPAFIEPGNLIRVDTRDGTYIERIKK